MFVSYVTEKQKEQVYFAENSMGSSVLNNIKVLSKKRVENVPSS